MRRVVTSFASSIYALAHPPLNRKYADRPSEPYLSPKSAGRREMFHRLPSVMFKACAIYAGGRELRRSAEPHPPKGRATIADPDDPFKS
jgi:hypothetical protein